MELDDGNETLYIQNLNEKIKPQGTPHLDMRLLLSQLFSQYGTLLDVIVQDQYRMKGQAFIIYDSKQDSSNALRLLQNYFFYGKALKISYAQTKSDQIARRDGTFIDRPASHSSEKRSEFFKRLSLKSSLKNRNDLELSNGQHSHNILFLERLELSVTESFLSSLFSRYQGFKEVRLIPEKGVAFIEFANGEEAAKAMIGLNGYKVLPTCQFFITYAKRG